MRLTPEQSGWLNGEGGPALQWATEFNHELGMFFDAPHMVPIGSAHFAPDTRMAGQAGMDLLVKLVDDGARAVVPGYLDPCSVDVGRAAELIANYGLPEAFVAEDRELFRLCVQLGFLPTQSCINYQTIAPPRFGEHVAWGDTGAAISANALFGARTNFEGGPSALASALTGCTPAYGMHRPENRRANLKIKIECEPEEIADWGAIAAWAGGLATGYETVPVFYGSFAPPSFNMLKQLGVALASYGGHAMFHVAGATPEAPSLETACGGAGPMEENIIEKADLEAVFERNTPSSSDVDLVVFAAPQLSVDEVAGIETALGGRSVHGNVKLIIAVDPQVKSQADNAGLTERLEAQGAEFSTGTCFYSEAPLFREATGWRTVVTNSAKLTNTLASAGYETALRRMAICAEAATTGVLAR